MIVTHQERRRSSGIHVAVVAPQVRSTNITKARESSYSIGREQGSFFHEARVANESRFFDERNCVSAVTVLQR